MLYFDLNVTYNCKEYLDQNTAFTCIKTFVYHFIIFRKLASERKQTFANRPLLGPRQLIGSWPDMRRI